MILSRRHLFIKYNGAVQNLKMSQGQGDLFLLKLEGKRTVENHIRANISSELFSLKFIKMIYDCLYVLKKHFQGRYR